MLKYFTFCFPLVLVLLATDASYSQSFSQNKYWVSGGAGKSHLPSGMVALGYEFADRPTLFVARYSLNTEVFSPSQPNINVSELGLLYGLRAGKFRFSTGLSSVWGTKRGKYLYSDPDPLIYGSFYYEPIKYRTVGIPAEIRFITSAKHAGLGVTGFANWNAKQSFAGLNVSVYVGRMK